MFDLEITAGNSTARLQGVGPDYHPYRRGQGNVPVPAVWGQPGLKLAMSRVGSGQFSEANRPAPPATSHLPPNNGRPDLRRRHCREKIRGFWLRP